MKTIRISRRRWLRYDGDGYDSGELRAFNGKQCCLGFVCRQLGGFTPAEILQVSMPSDLVSPDSSLKLLAKVKRLPKWLLGVTSKSDVGRAANVNDSAKYTDAQREARIKKIFAKHNLRAVFVD